MINKTIEKLEQEFGKLTPLELIVKANKAYRIGTPVISDADYDKLISDFGLKDGDPVLMDVNTHGVEVKLPFIMASMDKVKSLSELTSWLTNQRISKFVPNPLEVELVLTPKYDGSSLLNDRNASKLVYSRGDGDVGRPYNSEWYSHFIGKEDISVMSTFGELIIPKSKFFNNPDFVGYSNPRNTIAGLMNGTEPKEALKHAVFIQYGVSPKIEEEMESDKSKLLDILNMYQPVKVPYELVKVRNVTTTKLQELFEEWGKEFELDGIIMEINDFKLRQQIGRETGSNNPAYARAFKGIFDESRETIVTNVTYNPNKDGEFKPVIHIKPIEIQGVTISKLFGDSVRFLYDYGIGIDSNITVKRSGGVIPRISKVEGIEVMDSKKLTAFRKQHGMDTNKLLNKPENGLYKFSYPLTESLNLNNPQTLEMGWLDDIEFGYVHPEESEEVAIQRLIFFFECLGVKGVSDSIITDLYKKGYTTVGSVLELTADVMCSWDGYGESKSNTIINELNKRIKEANIEKIMHGSNCFKGMGEDKLLLLENFNKHGKWTVNDIITVPGFSDISAGAYVDGRVKFEKWLKDQEFPTLEFKEVEKKETIIGKYTGKKFCFTKFRDKDLEKIITDNGGEVTENLTKDVTTLVIKSLSMSSSKKDKAAKWNIPVIDHDGLKSMLQVSVENDNSLF